MPITTKATTVMLPNNMSKKILIPERDEGLGSSTWSLGGSKNLADGIIFDLSSVPLG